MPPAAKSNAHRGGKVNGKSKKQEMEDDFERFLATLSKTTEHAGKERMAQVAKSEKAREAHRQKRAELEDSMKTNEVEKALLNQQKNMQLQQLLNQIISAQQPFGRTPVTTFHSEEDTDNPHFPTAVGSMQGWRAQMEDTHAVDSKFPDGSADSGEGVFCVFDGHSGVQCANLCKSAFPATLRRCAEVDADTSCHKINFEKAFLDIDGQLKASMRGAESGCTAVAVHITPHEISCGWVGDSRAVLCRNGEAFDLSYDHKPQLEAEEQRIKAAGGFVQDDRVNGQLAMSRAMGDFVYKTGTGSVEEQLVIASPGVITTKRESSDSFVVLACDGIFDVLTNQQLIELILLKKADGLSNTEVCHEVCNNCLAPVSATGGPATVVGTDNMTIMIVDLH